MNYSFKKLLFVIIGILVVTLSIAGVTPVNASGKAGTTLLAQLLKPQQIVSLNTNYRNNLDIETETPTETPTESATPTETATETPTETATETPTESPTETMTVIPTETATETATETQTETLTETPSPTKTMTVTPSETATQTQTVTSTPTQTETLTATQTSTVTVTATQTQTPSPTMTNTRTVTPSKTSTKTPTATRTPNTLILSSIPAHDGWVLETSETSGIGGTLNNSDTILKLGDDATKKQYRAILSFGTSNLPDNANITGLMLKVKKQSINGSGNPASIFDGFMFDISNSYFGTSTALYPVDFQAPASAVYGPITPGLVNNIYSFNLIRAKAFINKLQTDYGLTQIRMGFRLDDNNNTVANVLNLYSGNAAAADRPQLVITYTVP